MKITIFLQFTNLNSLNGPKITGMFNTFFLQKFSDHKNSVNNLCTKGIFFIQI